MSTSSKFLFLWIFSKDWNLKRIIPIVPHASYQDTINIPIIVIPRCKLQMWMIIRLSNITYCFIWIHIVKIFALRIQWTYVSRTHFHSSHYIFIFIWIHIAKIFLRYRQGSPYSRSYVSMMRFRSQRTIPITIAMFIIEMSSCRHYKV